MAQRIGAPPTSGGFKKGQSGNPGGRPKALKDVEAAAREHTDLAIKTLARICGDAKAPEAAQIAAATTLLNRGYGKPRQVVDLNTNVSDLPDDALQRRIAERLAELLAAGPGAAGTDGRGPTQDAAPGSGGILH